MHTLRVRSALPRGTRSALDASRLRPACLLTPRQVRWTARPWRWKRGAERTWLERCRASGIEPSESESSILIRGMKIWVLKRCGVAKRPITPQIAKAMITVRGWHGSIRSSTSSSNPWANAPRCFTFHNAVRFRPIWAANGGQLIVRRKKLKSPIIRAHSSDLCHSLDRIRRWLRRFLSTGCTIPIECRNQFSARSRKIIWMKKFLS